MFIQPPTFSYDAATNTFRPLTEEEGWFNYGSWAINRDGSLFGYRTNSGVHVDVRTIHRCWPRLMIWTTGSRLTIVGCALRREFFYGRNSRL